MEDPPPPAEPDGPPPASGAGAGIRAGADWAQVIRRHAGWPRRVVLTRGLVRTENMRSTVKTISFRGGSGALTVKHDLGQRPTDVWIGAL